MYADQIKVSNERINPTIGLATNKRSATGVPAQKSMAKRIPPNAIAVPRSGCSMTSASGAPTSRDGTKSSRSVVRGSFRCDSSRASTSTVEIFATSDG